ncbi:probable RNA methyltransferase At5g51130 isoform X2 [Quercus suber]|uniref:probable RNA methyltransferase At5g51130 isoform X2 n=1 Tax=Quercus suber TaxID=58331 RepID=UPI0032DF9380
MHHPAPTACGALRADSVGAKPNMEQQHQHNKRKRKPVFVFGNYKNYYGYRIGQDLQEDPRLNVFKKELFEDKECLDIGCNSGIITILIAQKFHCRSILGIDIDSDRIEDANWHLKKFERAAKTHAKASKLEVSRSENGSEQSVAALPNEEMMEISRDCSSTETNLFHMVSFQQENFVQSRCPPEKKYDTILCLSVTKWVHLNWGDDGLITLFSKIWRLLRPGGVLVLEPQPWKSYENNRLVSETTAMNYRSILFRPAKFQEILLDKIGFRKVEDITSHLSGSKAGFNRPILVFHK